MRVRLNIFALMTVRVLGLSAAAAGAVNGDPAGAAVTTGPGGGGQPVDTAPADIHDIRHPVQVGVTPAIYYWAGGLAAALVLGLAAWLLLRRWKKRRNGGIDDLTAAIYRNPEEELLEGLAGLENIFDDRPVMFYFGLSAVFRRYLQRRFNIDAPEMTTEELLPCLSGLDLDRETQAGIKTFLKFGDQVKFARVMPDPGDMTAHLDLVRGMAERFREPASTADAEGGRDVSAG